MARSLVRSHNRAYVDLYACCAGGELVGNAVHGGRDRGMGGDANHKEFESDTQMGGKFGVGAAAAVNMQGRAPVWWLVGWLVGEKAKANGKNKKREK